MGKVRRVAPGSLGEGEEWVCAEEGRAVSGFAICMGVFVFLFLFLLLFSSVYYLRLNNEMFARSLFDQ